MKIGFTGTRAGLTEPQKARLLELLSRLETPKGSFGAYHEFHHGACVGADEEATEIRESCLTSTCVAYPCTLASYVSQKAIEMSGIVHKPKPPLERDQDLVNAVDMLIACPKSIEEEIRSGTWATVRMARRRGIYIVIIYPDGCWAEENFGDRP